MEKMPGTTVRLFYRDICRQRANFVALQRRLRQPDCSITKVSLWGSLPSWQPHIDEESNVVVALARAIANNCSVRSLTVVWSGLRVLDAQALVNAIEDHPTVTMLHVCDPKLPPKAVAALARVLASKTLTHLKLSMYGSQKPQFLAPALVSCLCTRLPNRLRARTHKPCTPRSRPCRLTTTKVRYFHCSFVAAN